MALTEIDICNEALSRLGEYKITSFVQDTPAAEKCAATYEQSRNKVLELHRWNFARKSAALAVAWVTIADITSAGGLVQVHKVAHGRTTGERVTLDGTATDGQYLLTVVDADYFTLDNSVYVSGTVGRYALAPLFGYAYRFALPADCLFMRSVDGEDAQMPSQVWELEGRELFSMTDTPHIVYTKLITDVTIFPNTFIDCLTLRLAADLAMPITGAMTRRTELLNEYVRVAVPQAVQNNAIEKNLRIIRQDADSPVCEARRFGECW